MSMHLEAPPDYALAVLERLERAGHEAYFVGGCVRDRVLGRPVGDWDVTTRAHPEEVVALFPRVVPTGLKHGTVTVLSEGEPVEVTTYRVELGYTDGRRPDEVAFSPHLALDLERRDFTMNAMAWNPIRDTFVDLHAGLEDLARRRVRAVGRAEARFGEDGLRALRAVRFAAVLQLEIDPETAAAISPTRPVFRRVSAERVQVELFKLILGPDAGRGVHVLHQTGLLEDILGTVSPPDVVAACAAIDRAPFELEVRLAILLRGLSPEHSANALERLKPGNGLRARVGSILQALRGVDPGPERPEAEVRSRVAALGRDTFRAYLAASTASREPDRIAFGERAVSLGALDGPLSVKELALDGREVQRVLDVGPSRRIGVLLERLLMHVHAHPEENTPEDLRRAVVRLDGEVADGPTETAR
jgi:tRNA nucleotidyltransferase (CCA-adding enzyme)